MLLSLKFVHDQKIYYWYMKARLNILKEKLIYMGKTLYIKHNLL